MYELSIDSLRSYNGWSKARPDSQRFYFVFYFPRKSNSNIDVISLMFDYKKKKNIKKKTINKQN